MRLISKHSIFALPARPIGQLTAGGQLTVTPLMHLKCPRIQTAGLLCAPDGQKNSPEQQEDRQTQNFDSPVSKCNKVAPMPVVHSLTYRWGFSEQHIGASYGNRNREMVQQRKGVRLHLP